MAFPKELPAPVYAAGTMPVGMPVKVFEPYSAPAFTTPAVALGAIVAPVTMQSTVAIDQTSVPFTFGHSFVEGDLSPDCGLAGAIAGQGDLPLQFNVKATHANGSVRHAIISGVLPSLPAGASVVMGLKRTAANVSGGAAVSPDKLATVTLTIAGAVYTTISDLSKTRLTHFAGPIASDRIIDVPFVAADGTPHPALTAQFSVRSYVGGNTRIDVTVEHTKAYYTNGFYYPAPTPEVPTPKPIPAQVDVTYDVAVTVNGAQVYSKAGLVHFPCARWRKSFWTNGTPAVHVKHDTAYLIRSRAVPNYDQTVKVPESVLAGYATSLASGIFEPMQFGPFHPSMEDPGGRPELGLMPDSYVAALLTMDKRAKDMMLACAGVAGSWAMHRRDDSQGPNKGLPLSVINFPCATILGIPTDANNPKTGKNEHFPRLSSASKGNPDCSHQAAFSYLPYLLTGDFYLLEELLFQGTFNAYQDNCGYRAYEKALVVPDQVRGQGWSLRTLAECAAFAPDDHPMKQTFMFWYESNMTWYNTTYIDAPNPKYSNKLGILTQGYALGYNNGIGMSPWMEDHFTSALGHGYELLGLDSTKRFLNWKVQFQIGRMLAPGACPAYAANYTLNVRASTTSPFYETLGEVFRASITNTYDANANTPEHLAALDAGATYAVPDGYPSTTEGFMANYQPALAYAVDVTGNLKAWQYFMQRTPKPDYGFGAQFAIVPRALTEVVVVPAPAPDPAPAPAPDPAPVPAPDPTPAPAPVPKPGTIKTPSNVKLAKRKGLTMTVFDPVTLMPVKTFAGLTASTKGAMSVTDAALIPGTTYAAIVEDTAGKVLDVMYPLTAV